MVTYESRHGWHPVDQETYLKLKLLHRVYWKTVHQFHDWLRWKRKQPQNRVLRHYLRNEKNQKIGYEELGPRPEPTFCHAFLPSDKLHDYGICAAYRQARMPVKVKENVQPLSMNSVLIDSLYVEVQGWLNRQK